MKLAALLILTACLGTTHWPAELSPDGSDGGRPVWDVLWYLSAADFEGSPYWRPGDAIVGPYYLVLSRDRSACLVSAAVFTLAHQGQWLRCPTAWRMPRP